MPSPDLYASTLAKLKTMLPPGANLCVGLSGGLDSVVLLDILHRARAECATQLSAVHINHQISPHANAWAEFCRALCDAKNIPLQVETVRVPRDSGLGLEAAARNIRHGIFARQAADFIALAHHADDQAETLLLQLLRGAGVKGAAAMPMQSDSKPALLRPLLDLKRADLEAYASRQNLQWITDESNIDTKYDRNFLRHKVMPMIEIRFPAYRETLSRATQNFAEAAQLLDELARKDAENALHGNALKWDAVKHLGDARAKNLLRFFFSQRGVSMPSAVRLEELLRQLQTSSTDAQVAMTIGEYEVRYWRGNIFTVEAQQPLAAMKLGWHGDPALPIPPLAGVLHFTPTIGEGVRHAKLQNGDVSIRLRQGGETLQPDAHRPRRTLKNLLQESHIPPWERERMPLLFCGDDLVWVPGIGVDFAYQAVVGEAGLNVSWIQTK